MYRPLCQPHTEQIEKSFIIFISYGHRKMIMKTLINEK